MAATMIAGRQMGGPRVQAEKTADYTLTSDDNGSVIPVNSETAKMITVPSGLPVGFTVTVFQKGAGAVTIAAGASVTRQHRQSHTKTAGQYAFATILVHASNTFAFQGDTAT